MPTICDLLVWPGRGDEPEPGKQFELAVKFDRHVLNARRIDPLENSVVIHDARLVELQPLGIDRPAREEVVASTGLKLQVCVDNNVNAGPVEILLPVHFTLCWAGVRRKYIPR